MSAADDGASPAAAGGKDLGIESHGVTIAKWVRVGQRLGVGRWHLVTDVAHRSTGHVIFTYEHGGNSIHEPMTWLPVRDIIQVYNESEVCDG